VIFDHRLRAPGLALRQRLPHADDREQARRERALTFLFTVSLVSWKYVRCSLWPMMTYLTPA
jgi:hypothetical protein